MLNLKRGTDPGLGGWSLSRLHMEQWPEIPGSGAQLCRSKERILSVLAGM